jgi:hypothetical protein
MSFAYLMSLLLLGSIAFALIREMKRRARVRLACGGTSGRAAGACCCCRSR